MTLFGNGRSTQRKFKDAELLDPQFPDVRLPAREHREQRHRFYRQRAHEEQRKTAITLYRDGWIGILYRLWMEGNHGN
jgi:hypothetical protein